MKAHSPSRFRVLMTILIIIACALAVFILRDQIFAVLRYQLTVRGKSGAQREVERLADDLRGKPILNQIQQWSADTVSRFDSGKIATNQYSPNWPIHAVVISSREVPDFIKNYRRNDQPEVVVSISTNSQAECVIIDWYLYGIVIGPTNRGQAFFNLYDYLSNQPIEPLYSVYVQPGVFAIWYDSK